MIITVFYSWILAYTFHWCFLITCLFHVVSGCLVPLSRPSDQTTGLPMPSPSSVACRIAWPHCQPDWSRAWRVSTFHGPFSRNTPQTVSLCIFTGSSLIRKFVDWKDTRSSFLVATMERVAQTNCTSWIQPRLLCAPCPPMNKLCAGL